MKVSFYPYGTFLLNPITPVLGRETYQTNPNGGTFYRMPGQNSSKLLRSKKSRKN